MHSPIAAVISWIKENYGIPAYFEFPKKRPERFAIVAQDYDLSDMPGIVEAGLHVRFFNSTPEAANADGQRFQEDLKKTSLQEAEGVTWAEVASGGYVMRDTDTKQPFRQVGIEITCHIKGE